MTSGYASLLCRSSGRVPRAVIITACGFAALMLASAGCGPIAAPHRSPPKTDASPTLPSAAAFGPAKAQMPADRLRAIAAGIGSGPTDCQHGRYDYVHIQMWARASRTIVPIEEHHWRGSDGAGMISEKRLAPVTADSNWHPAAARRDFPAARHTTAPYGPRGLAGAFPGDPSTEPARLAVQLHTNHPRANGPKAALDAVADLASWHHLNRAERAAVLRFLATVDTIAYAGPMVDWSGRTGLAFSVTDDTERDTLLVDRSNGDVLAYHQVIIRNPGGLTIRVPALHAYTLFVHHGRTNTAGQTATRRCGPVPQ